MNNGIIIGCVFGKHDFFCNCLFLLVISVRYAGGWSWCFLGVVRVCKIGYEGLTVHNGQGCEKKYVDNGCHRRKER